MSSQQFHLDIMSSELAVLDVRMPGTQRAVGLRPPSPATRVLMDAIREIVAENIPATDPPPVRT